MAIDDVTFRRWLAEVPPIVCSIICAVADGEPVSGDEVLVAASWVADLNDRLRRLPRGS